MKTGFKDPIEVKNPKKNFKWDFAAPVYDERTSCFIEAGSNYGKGHKQPVGGFKARSMDEVIPKGRIETLRTDYVREENIPYESPEV